ncbi:hypothetical protein ACFM35_00505 [Microbacterium sp. P01]|uniref:hypothetical protein n=1 Tax=unclassified Microbacterium TaxID=2609290 RepID=UPI00366D8C49
MAALILSIVAIVWALLALGTSVLALIGALGGELSADALENARAVSTVASIATSVPLALGIVAFVLSLRGVFRAGIVLSLIAGLLVVATIVVGGVAGARAGETIDASAPGPTASAGPRPSATGDAWLTQPLTWEGGLDVPTDSTLSTLDSFATLPEWTRSASSDTENWTNASTGCTVQFGRLQVPDDALGAGDRAASVQAIAGYLGTAFDEADATDVQLHYAPAATDTGLIADAVVIAVSGAGFSEFYVSRASTANAQAVLVLSRCPSDDLADQTLGIIQQNIALSLVAGTF